MCACGKKNHPRCICCSISFSTLALIGGFTQVICGATGIHWLKDFDAPPYHLELSFCYAEECQGHAYQRFLRDHKDSFYDLYQVSITTRTVSGYIMMMVLLVTDTK